MDSPKPNIPISDIYKVHLLDATGKTSRILVFCRGTMDKSNLSELFSKSEIEYIQTTGIEVSYVDSMLYKDDSVRIIKKKIMHELGVSNICYEEMYMFTKQMETINLFNLYSIITSGDNKLLTTPKIVQLLKNINLSDEEIKNAFSTIGDKDAYIYEDLVKLFQSGASYIRTIPFGQIFLDEIDYLFSANPFLIFDREVGLPSEQSGLVTFENQLLLNYKNLHENTLYVCLISDVFDFTAQALFKDSKVMETYYPMLFKTNIESLDDFNKVKPELLKKNKELFDSKTMQLYKTIDLLHDVYYSRKSDLTYTNTGIISVNFTIKSDMKIVLPLEIIFKNIHASKKVPYIKFNPGSRSENVYRLFTEQKTQDNKHIPYLSEQTITKLSREIGKSNQIAFYVKQQLETTEYAFTISILGNGDLLVSSELKTPHEVSLLNEVIKLVLNPVISDINRSLVQTGYKITTFTSLTQPNIVMNELKYKLSIPILKELDLNKYVGCISSVFSILEDSNHDFTLNFKRVENYKEMNEQAVLIKRTIERTHNIQEVIDMLMKNFKLDEKEASDVVVKYLNEHKDIRGKSVDNPGFEIKVYTSIDKHANIEIDDVNDIDYIETIQMYIDSIIRMSQYPSTTNVPKSEITSTCSRQVFDSNVDKPHIDNIVVTRFEQLMPQIEASKDIDELYGENKEDDGSGGIFFEEFEDIEGSEIDVPKTAVNESEVVDASKLNYLPPQVQLSSNKSPLPDAESSDSSASGLFFVEEDAASSSPVAASSDEKSVAPDKTVITGKPLTESSSSASSSSSSASGLFYIESGSSSSSEKSKRPVKGGDGSNSVNSNDNLEYVKKRIVGLSLKNPTLFYAKMKKNDPVLFQEDEGYSRACQTNVRRQPVVVSKKELELIDKEHPGSYTNAMKYSSDGTKENYYICPRYWCLLSNKSMTEQDVLEGKCAKEGKPDKIIPANASTVPSDAFVYEFNNKTEHIDEKGNYIPHYPGFLDKNDKGQCLPCCFKTAKKRWDTCLPGEAPKKGKKTAVAMPTAKSTHIQPVTQKEQMQLVSMKTPGVDKDKNIAYVVRYPIRQEKRFGFLPEPLQLFLQTDNNACVTENNPALIKPNTECILRYGVEHSKKQSILGCIADIYAFSQGLKQIPTIVELKKHLLDALTLDRFIKYHDSTLVSTFRPKNMVLEEVNVENYRESAPKLFSKLDTNNEYQLAFIKETILSFEAFRQFIRSSESIIDHTYMWDIVTDDNPKFIKGGVNLVILEMMDNDITNNIRVLCPTHSSFQIYDPRKETFLLFKKDELYEPIYVYKEVNGEITIKRTYMEQTAMKPIKHMLQIIQNVSKKQCMSLPSMPKVYKFGKNITLNALYKELISSKLTHVLFQVSNYHGKIIGIVISLATDKSIYVPCMPSYPINELEQVKTVFVDEDTNLWTDYQSTIDRLKEVKQKSNGKIPCEAKVKILENGLVVGILTETNQFVQIEPPSENIFQDNIPSIAGTNFIMADKEIGNVSVTQDTERKEMVTNIALETQFYSLFRNVMRDILNEYDNRAMRQKVISTFESSEITYRKKLDTIVGYLKEMAKDKVVFSEFDKETLETFHEISCSEETCGDSKYCMKRDDGICQLLVPSTHLISGISNETAYFGRIADELIRYKHIRTVIIKPKAYLNITSTDEYKLNGDEFLIVQSTLNGNYLKNMKPYNHSEHITYLTHSTAVPQVSQPYSNAAIPMEDQIVAEPEHKSELNDVVLECLKGPPVDIIGNQYESMWKRIFPKSAKELVFKNTSTNCSYYPLIYIFQDKYKQPINIQAIKRTLWLAYSEFYVKHKPKILKLLKKQGKRNIVSKIESGSASLETMITSEEYYITELDYWMFSRKARIQMCLFNKTGLKGINDGLEWLMLNSNFKESHYFIRAPALAGPNTIGSFNVVIPKFNLSELGEFEGIMQTAVSGKTKEYEQNIISLQLFLERMET